MSLPVPWSRRTPTPSPVESPRAGRAPPSCHLSLNRSLERHGGFQRTALPGLFGRARKRSTLLDPRRRMRARAGAQRLWLRQCGGPRLASSAITACSFGFIGLTVVASARDRLAPLLRPLVDLGPHPDPIEVVELVDLLP